MLEMKIIRWCYCGKNLVQNFKIFLEWAILELLLLSLLHVIGSIAMSKRTYALRCFSPAIPHAFGGGHSHTHDDHMENVYVHDTLKECVVISKSAGGIGVFAHNLCVTESYICGTNGISNVIVPILRVFNDTAHYVDQ